ncbi:GAF domain-containing protein [Halobaculum sp. WSA2]|uniref:histidine kinase n=1 Tax=Halobaculum saliterrae TaxID=2073113 RepID=A0A6B0SM96_9EURY|nr:GAF domain-containing sensor histidine kinase [Halobaculum saliterrae]MXR40038.1 GAF domain-containing protein [Halobaculum saliterrae]
MTANEAAADADDRLRSLYAATRDLMSATSRPALCRTVVDVSERVLGYTLTGVHLRGDDGPGLVPMAYPESVRERFDDDPPTYVPGDEVYGVYERDDPLRLGAVSERRSASHRGIVVPIPDHGVLIAGRERGGDADTACLELVELLGQHAAVALDAIERESRLNGLHETTRELMEARDSAAVAASATNTAHEVLDLRSNAVYLASGDGRRLVPVSVTGEARALFGEVPALSTDSLPWRVFESGEMVHREDARLSIGDAAAESTIRSTLIVPLGDHGVFLAGSECPGRFDESDVALTRLFADTVEAALDRAEREALLRRREGDLARQNERLDEFASVVSHDLRNPLNVAQGRLELLGDDCDSPHIDRMETAHERMDALIGDLLALARTGRSVGDTEPVSVERTVKEVWRTVDGTGSLSVADDVGYVEADASRLQELLENLFRNAVDHAGDGVDVAVGALDGGCDTAGRGAGECEAGGDGAAGPDAPSGFYVADDGPGIPPERHEAVFERGHTTADDGTGFGLAIVEEIAGAHGWSVRVAEADAGGARFEVVVDE